MGDDLINSTLPIGDSSSDESELDPDLLDSDALLEAFPEEDEDLLEEDPLAIDDDEEVDPFAVEDE